MRDEKGQSHRLVPFSSQLLTEKVAQCTISPRFGNQGLKLLDIYLSGSDLCDSNLT